MGDVALVVSYVSPTTHFFPSLCNQTTPVRCVASMDIAPPAPDPSHAIYTMSSLSGSDGVSYPYRVAIALNNTGVSLLECGEYQQALETFKGSINILRKIYFPGHGPTSDHHRSTELHRMMTLADQQLAAAFIPTSTAARATSNIGVRSISHDGTSFHKLNFVLDPTRAAAKYIPARIEIITSNCDVDDFHCASHQLDFQCALVVYNLALAHLCLVDDGSNNSPVLPGCHSEIDKVVPLKRGAIRLLQMVQSILRSSIEGNMAMAVWMKEARLALTCLSMINIAQVVQQHGSITEAEETFKLLSSTVDDWLQWNEFLAHLIGDTVTNRNSNCETYRNWASTPALPVHWLKLKWMQVVYRKFAAQAA
jgi:hypothetical protein